MALRCVGNQCGRTAAVTPPSGENQASLSMFARVAGGASTNDVYLFGLLYRTSLTLYLQGYYSPILTLLGSVGSNNGGATASGSRTYDLQPGITYHLALSYSAGTTTFYVNGTPSAPFVVPGTLGYPGSAPEHVSVGLEQFGGNAGTLDVTVDDVARWSGYALTAADVLALRNRTSAPSAISPAQLLLHLPLSGKVGAAAAIGDAGLADTSGNGLNVASLVGAPTYAAPLAYTPPAKVLSARIAPSGLGIAVLVGSAASGAPTNLATLAAAGPTASAGGVPLSLGQPAWGPGGVPARTRPPYLPWAYYPLASPVDPRRTDLTMTFPPGWATAALGEVGPAASLPVAPSSGPLLAPFVASPKAMKVGYNVNMQRYYYPVRTHANAFKGAVHFSCPVGINGFPAAQAPGTTVSSIVISSGANPNDSKGYSCFPTGRCTLMWDGADQLELFGSGNTTITLVSRALTGSANNIAVYDVELANPSLSNSPTITAYFEGPNIANPRLFDATVASPASPPKFHPSFLRMLAGADTLRSMDAFNTNASSVSAFSDFADPADYSTAGVTAYAALASIGPDTSAALSGSNVPILLTTAAPHGYQDGQTFALNLPSNCGPHGNGSFDLAGGGTLALVGYKFPARVLSPTTLGVSVYCSAGASPLATTYSGASLGSGPTLSLATRSGMAPADFLDLCAAAGANPWLNVPHAATDACAQQLGTLAAARVPAGKAVYLEYANEPWNSAPGFYQYTYIGTKAAAAGLSQMQWYTLRAGQVRDAFVAGWAASGRAPGDVRLVLNCQAGNPGTTSTAAAYAAANSIPFYGVAIAPYYSNAAATIVTTVYESGLASAYDAMSDEQVMDVGELMMEYGGQEQYGPAHLAALSAAGLPGCQLVCYEGGPDFGLPAYTGATQIGTRSRRWARHPRQRGIVLRYLQKLQDSGIALFNDYTANYQMAGIYSAENWAAYFGWDMRAGLGDGSDGQFDNRTNYEDYAHVVSVVGGAINTWTSLAAQTSPAKTSASQASPQ